MPRDHQWSSTPPQLSDKLRAWNGHTNPMNDAFDVVVVGAGPAGMAAAVLAAEYGRTVAIVDDNPGLGGQIWRGTAEEPPACEWRRRLTAAGVTVLPGWRVFHQPRAGSLRAERLDDVCDIAYGTLILATGARERFLPFPGWTLPNVMGAGGLQAMVKSGLPIANKRVVVAGSGPLLLAVAAYLRSKGAIIPAICEQASMVRLAWFAVTLTHDLRKLLQGAGYRMKISGTRFLTSSWPLQVSADDRLRIAIFSPGHGQLQIDCDYLACGFHLLPNVELAALLGCRIEDGAVAVNEMQQTSVANVLCAGESTGIGGLELSLVEGQIAGLVSAGQVQKARALFRKRRRHLRFAAGLNRAFALRPDLKHLPHDDTILCRCEDVRWAAVSRHTSWRSAKLHTRCGMGPCQGRICGAATEFLLGWGSDSPRPPIFPAMLANLAALRVSAENQPFDPKETT
jgi:NADPH-dependent 2,4-dienoyl-CoA reductase/sulfur reductase-like enzyme